MGCHSPAYWVGRVRVCSSRGRLSNSNPLLIRGPIKYLKRRGFAFAYAMSSFNDKPAHTYKMYIAWTEMAQCWEHSIPSMSPGFEFWRRHWDEFVIESLLCSERFFFWALRFRHLLKHQHVQNSSSVWTMYFNNWINLKGHKFINYLNCWVSPALNDG